MEGRRWSFWGKEEKEVRTSFLCSPLRDRLNMFGFFGTWLKFTTVRIHVEKHISLYSTILRIKIECTHVYSRRVSPQDFDVHLLYKYIYIFICMRKSLKNVHFNSFFAFTTIVFLLSFVIMQWMTETIETGMKKKIFFFSNGNGGNASRSWTA